jgi:uncharacterized membrane protein YeaQ/YmgE (transglycosylase-associated protein family)
MIGMGFGSFIILLVMGVVAAGVIHYGARYRFLEGIDGLIGKCLAGWVGAWLGSPVLGHWFERVKFENIYLIPALLGAFGGAFMLPASAKALAKVFGSREAAPGIREEKKAA